MKPSSLPRAAGCLAVAATLLLSAACGGGDGKKNDSDAFSKFQDCLRQNGVTVPQGGGRPSGAPSGRPSGARRSGSPTARPSGASSGIPSQSAERQKAMQACASLRPEGGRGQRGPGGQGGPAGQPPNNGY